MNGKTAAELRDDLVRFDNCMLVTWDGELLRSRPMRAYSDNPDGTIRFLTARGSHKVSEAEERRQANTVFADEGNEWISVSGTLRASDRQADIDELWSAEAEPWFDNGKADAIVLILEPRVAEYWEVSTSKLKASWEMVRGAVTGKRPEDVGEHGKVRP